MSNNINYELPPIKKVGPAVLPKPKNIKIQAGRVIRLNYAPSLDNTDRMNSRFIDELCESMKPPTPPPLLSDLVYEKNQQFQNDTRNYNDNDDDNDDYEFKPSPYRPKFVQIPVEIETTNYSDQYKFPKKSPKVTYIPTNIQPVRTLTLNGIRNNNHLTRDSTTINFSADGAANRPTITITTGRGPNSPTITNSTSNGFTYNIPIQHVGSNRNFIISTQENSAPSIITNTTGTNSYIIPVKLSNTSPTTVNINNSPVTERLSSPNNIGNIYIKTNRALSNKSPTTPTTNTRVEDEVDLLKDLLVKNLNSSTHQNEQQQCVGVCTKCNQKIIGAENGLKSNDCLYHINCFVCHGCGYSLQDQHFYSMENKTFCEECYNRLLEKCSFCLRPITERILRATGKPFHPECFNCIVCKKNLDGIPFTVDASNKIHCIECFHEKYAPRCFICRLPITPENGMEETVRIVSMDKNFHINCYKCEDCGVSLSSNTENTGGCFPLDDHIYCKSCSYQHLKNLVNAQGTSVFPNNLMTNNQTPRSTDL
ncbi:unnamed protein product [Brachionus calyciflorus]|uniref:Zyxin n=1 Tax=Brachionus calyciflorus TaxID=104777 RepID=A0A814AHC6_9BILA|nr:unnamed protein product [Brachionus calyciflorus]